MNCDELMHYIESLTPDNDHDEFILGLLYDLAMANMQGGEAGYDTIIRVTKRLVGYLNGTTV